MKAKASLFGGWESCQTRSKGPSSGCLEAARLPHHGFRQHLEKHTRPSWRIGSRGIITPTPLAQFRPEIVSQTLFDPFALANAWSAVTLLRHVGRRATELNQRHANGRSEEASGTTRNSRDIGCTADPIIGGGCIQGHAQPLVGGSAHSGLARHGSKLLGQRNCLARFGCGRHACIRREFRTLPDNVRETTRLPLGCTTMLPFAFRDSELQW